MQKEIKDLCSELGTKYPRSNPQLKFFPSGAAMMDLTVGPDTYVLEYLPAENAFGVSKMSNAVFGWEGVEHAFPSIGEAKEYLDALLKRNA